MVSPLPPRTMRVGKNTIRRVCTQYNESLRFDQLLCTALNLSSFRSTFRPCPPSAISSCGVTMHLLWRGLRSVWPSVFSRQATKTAWFPNFWDRAKKLPYPCSCRTPNLDRAIVRCQSPVIFHINAWYATFKRYKGRYLFWEKQEKNDVNYRHTGIYEKA